MSLPKGVELKTPLTADDVRKLKPGDIVYITGYIWGGSGAQWFIRLVEEGKKPPIDVKPYNVMAIGGGISKDDVRQVEGKWILTPERARAIQHSIICTTGLRYEKWVPSLIRLLGLRAFLAKDGLGPHQGVRDACKEVGCVTLAHYAAPPAKGRVTKSTLGVKDGFWFDMPRPTWILEVDKSGPWVVNIDTKGNSFYGDFLKNVDKRVAEVYKKRGITDYKYIALDYKDTFPEKKA